MLKTELEKAVIETHNMLRNGVVIHLKEISPKISLVSGFIFGGACMLGSIAVQEIRNHYIRTQNRKWFEKNKEEQ